MDNINNNFNVESLRKAVESVMDPDLSLSLGELGAIKDLSVIDESIKIKLELVQPIHWVAPMIDADIVKAVKEIAPDAEVETEISEVRQDFSSRELLPNVKNIIAVASGKGGVGKSSVSANIAAALASMGAKTGLLDGDIYGPSQPTMYDLKEGHLEAYETPDGKTHAEPLTSHGVKIASMGFVMDRNQAAIIRGPMLAGYFSLLFEQVNWGPLDFLVFDLPPGTGDIQLTMTQKIPLTGAVVVTTPQEISVADVRRSIAMFDKVNVKMLGIVENMSYFVPPDMPDKKYYIFGKGGGRAVANENEIPFLGEIPLDMQMREGNDSGKPVVLDPDNKQADVLKAVTCRMVANVRRQNHEKILNPDVKISM